MASAPPRLETLSWHKVSLSLRNTRNLFAREHPLSIFQSVFNHAAAGVGGRDAPIWFFHPLGAPLGPRMQRGREYALELVFINHPNGDIESFLARLRDHLENPRNNFVLTACSAPQRRSLAVLLAEREDLREAKGEICLEFFTPLPFDLVDSAKRWLLTREGLTRLFQNRLDHLFNLQMEMEHLWAGVHVLPFFWNYTEYHHQSKSNQGRQYINGAAGPLYLKGELEPVLPLLLLGSELHLGRRLASGQGYYRLETGRPFFDLLLESPEPLFKAWQHMQTDSDLADELPAFAKDPQGETLALKNRILEGGYRPEPAQGFTVTGKSGQARLLAQHHPEDMLVQRALLEVLEPVCDRMLEEASVGYRRGRTRRTAFDMITRFAGQGYAWVVETDIASCFDMLDWGILFAKLEYILPRADSLARGLLESFITCPLNLDGKPRQRDKGALQGGPLSPLLTNLYLDSLDEEMEAKGYRLVRYADDILIMVRDEAQGRQALQDLTEALGRLGLALKPEKTAVRPLGAGVCFMGADLGEEFEERGSERALLRKTLYVREQRAFLGLEQDSLVVKGDGRTLARLPLRRLDEIVVFGNNGVSIRLIHRLSKLKIPISFCSTMGFYVNTLRPDSKAHFELAGLHAARHAGLSESQVLALAGNLVRAKIANYAAWVKTMRGPEALEVGRRLAGQKARVAACPSVESLRGLEAEAARAVFGFLNARLKVEGFSSPGRLRRRKADPYNSLLDFAYFLLFCQVNVTLRGMGLNPYLGLLHSHKDNYESLVSDLVEPFRYRMDRMVARALNLGIIKPVDLEPQPGGGYRLAHEALPRFLEAFERELALWLVGEPACLQDLIAAQAAAVARWLRGGENLAVFDLSLADCGGVI